MTHYVIAIDPGIADLGIVVFKKGKLVYANLVRHDKTVTNTSKNANMLKMTVGLTKELQLIETLAWPADQIKKEDTIDVVIEFTQAGGFMATFVKMGFVCGSAVGHFCSRADYFLPQSNQWKISRDKETTHQHYLASLSTRERKLLDRSLEDLKKKEQGDVLDAVGIGIWHINNLKEGDI